MRVLQTRDYSAFDATGVPGGTSHPLLHLRCALLFPISSDGVAVAGNRK